MPQHTGTLKWFNPGKRYGFIKPDTGSEDVFLHIDDLPDDITPESLQSKQDARVKYNLEQNGKGLKAVNLVLV